jgi:tetratricopeptide (TPR) repeat protein
MNSRQFIFYADFAALVLVISILSNVSSVRKRLFKRRVLQQMAERGERPRLRRWTFQNVAVVVLVVASMTFGVFRDRLAAAYGLIPINLVFFGGIGLLVFIGSLIFLWRNTDATVNRAYALMHAGRIDEAIAMLEAALAEKRTPRRAGGLGWVLLRAERFSEAAEQFRQAAEMDPKQLSYAIERVLAMSKAGDREGALAVARYLRAGRPEEGAFALAEASVLADLGRGDEAREQLRQGEELMHAFPNNTNHPLHTITSLRKSLNERIDPGVRAFEVRRP